LTLADDNAPYDVKDDAAAPDRSAEPEPLVPPDLLAYARAGDVRPRKPARRGTSWRAWAVRAAVAFLLACVTAVAVHWGVLLRHDVWDQLSAARHTWDINNAWRQGTAVNDAAARAATTAGRPPGHPPTWADFYRGYVGRYDQVVADAGGKGGRYSLDYVPLRLLAASLWVRHNQMKDPTIQSWQPEYAVTAPMLRFNTAVELATCVGMFLLVWHWVRRGVLPPGPRTVTRVRRWWSSRKALIETPASEPTGEDPDRGQDGTRDPRLRSRSDTGVWGTTPTFGVAKPVLKPFVLAWLAAMFVWLDPSLIFNAHVWPQWDCWILPWFVFAAWLASCGRWVPAGICLGIGTLFKGQILIAAPVFALWPLFEGRPGATLRVAIGYGVGLLVPCSVWLVPSGWAWAAVGGAVVAAAALAPWFWMRRRTPVKAYAIAAVSAVVLIAWPWVVERQPGKMGWAAALAVVVIAGPALLPRRALVAWLGAVVVLALVAIADLYGGSWNWWEVGVAHGTKNHPGMAMGPASNLAAILGKTYGWSRDDAVFASWMAWPAWLPHAPGDARADAWLPKAGATLTMKQFLGAVNAVCVLLIAWGAARMSRRNDPRFLIAIVAPFVVSFAVLPQMHERYWLWAGVLTAAGVGASGGMALMHVVVTLASLAMMLAAVLPGDGRLWPDLRFFAVGAHPGLGWLVLLTAALYLYVAVTPSKRGTSSCSVDQQVH